MSTVRSITKLASELYEETGCTGDFELVVSPKVLARLTDGIKWIDGKSVMPRAKLVIETGYGTVTVRSNA